MLKWSIIVVVFSLWLAVIACTQDSLPVQNTSRQAQHALACLTMYAVNSQCFARPDNGDTTGVNVLALELKLASVQHRGDTSVFFFYFYRIAGRDTVIYEPYSQDLASCRYNGIVVTKSGRFGVPSTLGDYTLGNVDTQFVKNALVGLRQRCLQEDITKSETLRGALAAVR
jgi:hypothetical protein